MIPPWFGTLHLSFILQIKKPSSAEYQKRNNWNWEIWYMSILYLDFEDMSRNELLHKISSLEQVMIFVDCLAVLN